MVFFGRRRALGEGVEGLGWVDEGFAEIVDRGTGGGAGVVSDR